MAYEFCFLKVAVINQLFNELEVIKDQLKNIQQKQLSEQWIDSKDVPNYLGCSAKTWQKLRDERKIKFTQYGSIIRVKVSDLEIFLENHSVKRK
ncbi:excisionase family DNA binding protein [Mucilaginibacter sp. SG538B]|uniref:helix-turn-helix domain-containing protein n=1 Tax=Mucilaginibacter sp. SG538B TaxID=2587021 RepID=UPI00159D668E|nr:helix-turn-helix domain-containing protein [Mucilaginibacter sp. SG538B]NVM63224.1 excisionase family DNA binding protein [Mucilaginibacter sp. SG538B]